MWYFLELFLFPWVYSSEKNSHFSCKTPNMKLTFLWHVLKMGVRCTWTFFWSFIRRPCNWICFLANHRFPQITLSCYRQNSYDYNLQEDMILICILPYQCPSTVIRSGTTEKHSSWRSGLRRQELFPLSRVMWRFKMFLRLCHQQFLNARFCHDSINSSSATSFLQQLS